MNTITLPPCADLSTHCGLCGKPLTILADEARALLDSQEFERVADSEREQAR